MLLTIYYRKGCIKSRFLRAALRIMDWDLRESDVDDPASKAELEQMKSAVGKGETPLVPAVWTSESYSHEMYCLIEYLNDRSPSSMYPDEPSTRLFARTMIHRVLRKLSTLWPEYRETGDPTALLAFYDETEELIASSIRAVSKNGEVDPDRPKRQGFVEMLFFAILIEVNHIRPITHKQVKSWYRSVSSRAIFADLVAEPSTYFRSDFSKLD